jgi:hypothetical protein
MRFLIKLQRYLGKIYSQILFSSHLGKANINSRFSTFPYTLTYAIVRRLV